MNYKCNRCAKTFNQKIHLINHLKKINLCPPTISDLTPGELLKELIGGKKTSVDNNVCSDSEPVQNKDSVPIIHNTGNINIFILPAVNGDETQILSTTNYTDVGSAINSILGLIINKTTSSESVKNIK
jgi:hypothetical protein